MREIVNFFGIKFKDKTY